MSKKFYVTTPIYYVNAKPHIGHAYTTVAADVLARFHKLLGEEVFFSAGTDEHGLKIQQKAAEAGKQPREFADEISGQFKDLWEKLNIKYSDFIRTTDDKHKAAVQVVLQKLFDKGAIYKGTYKGLYCVGCEQFLNEKDLIEGKCPDHDKKPEVVEEEAYLLKLAAIQDELIKRIKSKEFHITPQRYENEVLSLLEGEGLRDVSVSRKNVSWGIPLPFDAEHTTYVWVDAFLNYLTVLGWGGEEKSSKFWPADVSLIGKDILRVHATIWPAILLHLGLPLPKQLVVHGHILSDGKKMSKTLGNAISIDEMLEKFGVDGTRYLLMSAGAFGEDVDVTMEILVERYNAQLANNLGNLVSRVIKINEGIGAKNEAKKINWEEEGKRLADFQFNDFLDGVFKKVNEANKKIEETKLWELVKADEDKAKEILESLLGVLSEISELLELFLPETSEKIKKILETNKAEILFPRIK